MVLIEIIETIAYFIVVAPMIALSISHTFKASKLKVSSEEDHRKLLDLANKAIKNMEIALFAGVIYMVVVLVTSIADGNTIAILFNILCLVFELAVLLYVRKKRF